MSHDPFSIPRAKAIEFGDLLAHTVGAVVSAQERLDAYTLQRRQAYEQAPDGSLALPPLWYAFQNVALDLELSASVVETSAAPPGGTVAPGAPASLLCRTVDPATVGLYGYQATAGVRVRLLMGPQGPVPVKAAVVPADPPSTP